MSIPTLSRTAPGTCHGSWLGWVYLGAALTLAAVGAAVIINQMWERVDECRRVQTELALLQADAYELDALQGDMITMEKLGAEMFREMENIRTRMHERISLLDQMASNRLELGEFTKKYEVYVVLVDQEFKLLAAAKIKEARQFDVDSEDPAFDALQSALAETENTYAKTAAHMHSMVRLGIFLVLLAGMAGIAVLIWRFNKERHMVEIADAGQRLLNEANGELESRVRDRTAELSALNRQMEQRIAERTSELEQTNATLQTEIAGHKLSKKELQAAFDRINTLKGLLPICASCKRIRDESGAWADVEGYIQNRSEAHFSHGICPDCAEKLYPDIPIS